MIIELPDILVQAMIIMAIVIILDIITENIIKLIKYAKKG